MDAFIIYSVKTSVCITAGYLVYYLVLRNETFHILKRFILLGIIVVSAILPILRVPAGPSIVRSRILILEEKVSSAPALMPTGNDSIKPNISPAAGHSISPSTWIYLFGACFQAVMVLLALVKLARIIRKSQKVNFRGIPLRIVPFQVVPFCFARQIIMSEKDYSIHADEILHHEMTHYKRLHFLDLCIAEVVLILTWYNPFSWLLSHEIKQNHEFEADYNVIRQGFDPAEYQLLLVRNTAGESRFKLANQFNQSNLKTRLAMMNKPESAKRSILKALVVVPMIIILAQVFAQHETNPAGAVKGIAPGKYLVLPADRLSTLGFIIEHGGLYYKNARFGDPEKGILCLYFTDDVYSSGIILHKGETITGSSSPERFLKKQTMTDFDFYPVVVSGFNGSRTQDMIAAEKDPQMKLLPVQVNMALLDNSKRNDTLVFWFKPTASLKLILAEFANMDDYLQPCPDPGKKVR